jgi:hypothetical protein
VKTLLALLLCTLALPCRAQEKETIALNLEKGETYSYSTRLTNYSTMRVEGKMTRTAMFLTFEADFLVREANSGWLELEATFHDISVKTLPAGEAPAFDTEAVARLLDSLARVPVEINLGRQGRIYHVSDLAPLFAHFIAWYPDDEMVLRQVHGLLDDNMFHSIGYFTYVLPDEPVAEGESWTLELQQSSALVPIPMTTLHVSTLLKSEEECWEISDSCTMVTFDHDTYVRVPGGKMKGDVTGTVTNKVTLDKKSGWVLALELNQNSTNTLHVKSEDGTEDFDEETDMKCAMSITGKVPK